MSSCYASGGIGSSGRRSRARCQRLGRRFGSAIDKWFDALPAVLSNLAEHWDIEWGTVIQRGSMSVVIRCRTADGRPAVLKASPERERVADEAAALASWKTISVPALLAVDESVGALLIEAVEPGTPLVESAAYPRLESLPMRLAADQLRVFSFTATSHQ
jgi:hypothetical protein